jgi:asparagine synthase (glutamine-hydrolysing)
VCGIAGFLTAQPFHADQGRDALRRMAAAIAHRGPDGEGVWLDSDAGIGLCHRRLAIIDLSLRGRQPMASASGRLTISFNGEIYNYRELSRELQTLGVKFSSTSDTEVLLAAIEQWGLERALGRCRGMFAFALWDAGARMLYLARDRFGEKPLYFGERNGLLLFGSELKALRAHPAWHGEINRDAVAILMRHHYIPAPHSIFRGVFKLRPGHFARVKVRDSQIQIEERCYWEPSAIPRAVTRATDAHAGEAAIERVDTALTEAVRSQMVADVSVGAFLSGGIDSSLIVSRMQEFSVRPVQTFSIGFGDAAYNEAPFAKRMAQHLGTQHTEMIVAPSDALTIIPELPRIYDEPFADRSQIPTCVVSRLASQSVKVSLSGDAGDELFGGYAQYPAAVALWNRLRLLPRFVRRSASGALRSSSRSLLSFLTGPLTLFGPHRGKEHLADRLKETEALLGAQTFPQFYQAFVSFWAKAGDLVYGGQVPETIHDAGHEWPRTDELGHMMFVDTRQYLPDDILVKVDRAAMAVGLETRIPFLDLEVAQAAWSIPSSVHFQDGHGKWVLRKLLERRVPRAMFERPKCGFDVPLGQWLRGELRDWADNLLDPARLRTQGILVEPTISRCWRQHRDGSTDWSYQLWTVLMFEAWIDCWSQPAVKHADLSIAS